MVLQWKPALFVLKKIAMKNVEFLVEKLIKCEELEKKIKIICSFNNVKCNFRQGRILTLKNTNVSFIEPHRVEIKIKNISIFIIYYNKNNLFLYNRTLPIDTKKLDTLIKEIKSNL